MKLSRQTSLLDRVTRRATASVGRPLLKGAAATAAVVAMSVASAVTSAVRRRGEQP